MAARKKQTRFDQARSQWDGLSSAKKSIVGLGSIAVAVVGISGAWGVGEKIVESNRPWAQRSIETVVAGLQLQSDQFTLKQIDDRLFQIRFELSRNPASQFLRDELKRTMDQREKLQRRIDDQIRLAPR